ncbi:MAG: hypothetical protein GXP27_20990 [Planctomycetes bacterium]|nr:hypothetical protein [Planctomycetota bacterium]
MDTVQAEAILINAIEKTRPRWEQYNESWSNIDTVFIVRGYEQQGFQMFKMADLLEERGVLSIERLGVILCRIPHAGAYDRQFAGSLSSELYSRLRNGACGQEGSRFEDAIREFLGRKIGSPGRTMWKLLYQMLQACSHLRTRYSSSFANYVLCKYAHHVGRGHVSDNDFLSLTPSAWQSFLKVMRPWNELAGIGPNAFDFIFGDITEAVFARDSFKFDSANRHFLQVAGISALIQPFDREETIRFLKSLALPYTLREINKGMYTYCSITEGHNYGFFRNPARCVLCDVRDICAKNF